MSAATLCTSYGPGLGSTRHIAPSTQAMGHSHFAQRVFAQKNAFPRRINSILRGWLRDALNLTAGESLPYSCRVNSMCTTSTWHPPNLGQDISCLAAKPHCFLDQPRVKPAWGRTLWLTPPCLPWAAPISQAPVPLSFPSLNKPMIPSHRCGRQGLEKQATLPPSKTHPRPPH